MNKSVETGDASKVSFLGWQCNKGSGDVIPTHSYPTGADDKVDEKLTL